MKTVFILLSLAVVSSVFASENEIPDNDNSGKLIAFCLFL